MIISLLSNLRVLFPSLRRTLSHFTGAYLFLQNSGNSGKLPEQCPPREATRILPEVTKSAYGLSAQMARQKAHCKAGSSIC